jgi:hypothetical protein
MLPTPPLANYHLSVHVAICSQGLQLATIGLCLKILRRYSSKDAIPHRRRPLLHEGRTLDPMKIFLRLHAHCGHATRCGVPYLVAFPVADFMQD